VQIYLIAGCSKPKDLIIGKKYSNNVPSGEDYAEGIVYSGTEYHFYKTGVNIYKEVGKSGNILYDKQQKIYFTSNGNMLRRVGYPPGAKIEGGENLDVIFGPGDLVPIMELAPYKAEGTSVLVDWGQKHTEYFKFSYCNSGSEVFTIKNNGLVLESATQPGYNLTMSGNAPTKEEQLNNELMRLNHALNHQ